MRYVASEWNEGDVAMVTGASGGPQVRMLVAPDRYESRRLWWGGGGSGSNYYREDSVRDIERVTVLTNEELNRREEVNP